MIGGKMGREISAPYREILIKLMEGVKKRFDLISFVVYGSVARNEAGKESDIDILIIVEDLRDRYEALKLFDGAEKEVEEIVNNAEKQGYRVFFSPIIKGREEAAKMSPLYLDMVEDAVILYDRDDFFKSILERLRRRLKELGAERVRVGKKWYWRLKKDYVFGEVIEIE